MRLFEDSRWELTDPRRFRVEILFSPGATATPLHMHEQDRDNDQHGGVGGRPFRMRAVRPVGLIQ